MPTKFNQSMYMRMRAKKNEPLSSLGAKTVQVTKKGGPVTIAISSTPGTKTVRITSLDTSVEEINP